MTNKRRAVFGSCMQSHVYTFCPSWRRGGLGVLSMSFEAMWEASGSLGMHSAPKRKHIASIKQIENCHAAREALNQSGSGSLFDFDTNG